MACQPVLPRSNGVNPARSPPTPTPRRPHGARNLARVGHQRVRYTSARIAVPPIGDGVIDRCQDGESRNLLRSDTPTPRSEGDAIDDVAEGDSRVTDLSIRVLGDASFHDPALGVRCGTRTFARTDRRVISVGLRVARTCR